MKKVHALLLTTLLACSLVVVAATQALACSCVPPQPDRKAVKEAAAVFTGAVVEVEDGVEIGMDPVTWTFAVDTVYKGDVAERQQVTSHTQSAACGVVFKEEKRYIVFAHDGDETYPSDVDLATNSCMNTRPVAASEDIDLEPVREIVGPPLQPPGDHVERMWSPLSIALTALLVVGAIAGAVFAWKKDRKESV